MTRHVLQRFFKLSASVLTLVFLVNASFVSAQSISTAYDAPEGIQKGMIVMLDPNDNQKIKPLTSKKDAAMHGVVVSATDTIISIGGDGTTSQVFVASSGKYEVLVSNQNGAIKRGDVITISSLDGIGMKADTRQTVVLGKALTGFDGVSSVSGSMTITSGLGKRDVKIGVIAVEIGISHNPLKETASGPPIPAFLRSSGEAIAGKGVSTIRLYMALAILIVTVFITANLLYGGVRSSLVAIGRNPLAKGMIVRGLMQVIIMGVIIFVLGLFSIYLILKL